MGLLTVRVGVFLMLLPALGTFLLLLGCPIQPWYKGLCLVLLYLTVLGCYLWKACSILKGNEGEVNLREREEGKGNWEQWREGQLWSESIVLRNIYIPPTCPELYSFIKSWVTNTNVFSTMTQAGQVWQPYRNKSNTQV